MFVYCALLFGCLTAGALALYNAAALRRVRPAVVAVALVVLGLTLSAIAEITLIAMGIENVRLILLGGRVAQIVAGAGLAWSQWNYVKGHMFLDGKTIESLPAYLGMFVLFMVLPGEILAQLIFPWLFLL